MGLGVLDELLASDGAGLMLPSETSRIPEAIDSESRLSLRVRSTAAGAAAAFFLERLATATTCLGAGGGDSPEGT